MIEMMSASLDLFEVLTSWFSSIKVLIFSPFSFLISIYTTFLLFIRNVVILNIWTQSIEAAKTRVPVRKVDVRGESDEIIPSVKNCLASLAISDSRPSSKFDNGGPSIEANTIILDLVIYLLWSSLFKAYNGNDRREVCFVEGSVSAVGCG